MFDHNAKILQMYKGHGNPSLEVSGQENRDPWGRSYQSWVAYVYVTRRRCAEFGGKILCSSSCGIITSIY